MQIPKKLIIQGHIFEVIENDRLKTDANDKLGSVMFSDNKIWIHSEQSYSQKESTLLHEIIESANWFLKLEFKEDTICRLETFLYQVLKENELLK